MTLPRFLHANPVTALTTLDDDDTIAYRALLGRWLIDLALLSNNMLKGEALTKFVKRSIELI